LWNVSIFWNFYKIKNGKNAILCIPFNGEKGKREKPRMIEGRQAEMEGAGGGEEMRTEEGGSVKREKRKRRQGKGTENGRNKRKELLASGIELAVCTQKYKQC